MKKNNTECIQHFLKKTIGKINNRSGGSNLLTVLITMGLITFILFYPIAMFNITQNITLIEDLFSMSMQTVAIEGGLTDRAENIIFKNMEAKGIIPANSSENPDIRNSIILESNADARGGNTDNIIYKTDDNPVIDFAIWFPANKDMKFLDSVRMSILWENESGLDSKLDYYYSMNGYIISEKIDK